MKIQPATKIVAPIVPYATVGIGLLVFHNAWLAILAYHAGMIGVISLSGTGFSIMQSFRGKGFMVPLISAVAGVGGGLALRLIWPSVSPPGAVSTYVRSIGLNEGTWPVFLLYFVVVNPLVEECYWRGYLGSATRRVTLDDVLFAGYHLIVLAGQVRAIWIIAAFCALSGVAWFWRQVNRLNGRLLPSVVSHMTADITVMVTVYYMSMR